MQISLSSLVPFSYTIFPLSCGLDIIKVRQRASFFVRRARPITAYVICRN